MKILVLFVVLVVGVLASIRVWRVRGRHTDPDALGLSGMVPGPGDAGIGLGDGGSAP